MELLDLELRLWARASELWLLARTDLEQEERRQYQGRCLPLRIKWVTFRDRRRQHEPSLAQQAERWWSTIGNAMRDLLAFGGLHQPSTKLLHTCGEQLADQPRFCYGEES